MWLRGVWLVDIEKDASLVTQCSVLTMKAWTVKEAVLGKNSQAVKTEEAFPYSVRHSGFTSHVFPTATQRYRGVNE